MEATVRLHSLRYTELRTYLWAMVFVAGNIVVPQLVHMLPQGGLVWLPIYFFTLVGAYKYGWRVGLLTALLSPVVNHLLFGMPPAGALPAILLKSVLLAVTASVAARRTGGARLLTFVAVVAVYQLLGTAGEMLLVEHAADAFQDLRLGWPGMVMQAVGGWLVVNTSLSRQSSR